MNPGSLHIRGRVFFFAAAHEWRMTSGQVLNVPATWGMQVVNTRTGRILASDNACNYGAVVEQCERAVGAAREAWAYEFRRKDLR